MDQLVVFLTLLLALLLFAWGRVRHDLVALIALFLLVLPGIVSPAEAFSGFAHPAVITVAAVLVMGKGLEHSGLIDLLGRWVSRIGTNLLLQILALTAMVSLASAFMNNVGALAIMMPVALHLARKGGHPPSYLLMPIAFASLLGGMTTMIGTPPNIIIATFRGDEVGEPFGMFDFSPVGLVLTGAGLVFITLIGWRLLPTRPAPRSDADLFDIDDYITEVEVTADSAVVGRSIFDFIKMANVEMQVLGLVRRHRRIHAPDPGRRFQVGDVVIIETDADELNSIVENTGVKLVGGCDSIKDATGAKEISVTEAVVMADSPLIGRSVSDISLRRNHGINLLAVARKQSRIHRRLVHIVFRTGDVLLLQGRESVLQSTLPAMGCLPLARRGLTLGYKTRVPLALGIFGAATVAVMSGRLPVEAAFTLAAMAMVLTGILPLKELYKSIDWPVIVLLGAMIPVGVALETTGAAARIAGAVTAMGHDLTPWSLLAILLTVTMLLSAVINNAATVLIMAPIAMGVARGLGYCVDPFLMTVAIGGSAAFLTPIGHQSNTLVMGPGGYRFTDYVRMGLPMTVLVVLVGVPTILWIFPV